MERTSYEESRSDTTGFDCKNICPGVEKSNLLSPAPSEEFGSLQNQTIEDNVVSQTPEKTTEASYTKLKVEAVKNQQRYKTVAKFFDHMSTALRLLNLRKKQANFRNICKQVDILSKRRLSYSHLAQIKFILPESIQIDKILVHDETTLLMKPDLKITLLFDVIKDRHEQSPHSALRQIFASRLLNYCIMHLEDHDIPEAELPEPFNQGSHTVIEKELLKESLMESQSSILELDLLSDSSHLNPTFSKHFSEKTILAEKEQTLDSASPIPSLSEKTNSAIRQGIKIEQYKEPHDLCSNSTVHESSIHLCETPSTKIALASDSLMVTTPAQVTPKISMPSCEDKLKSSGSQNWRSCNMPTRRSLFSNLGDDGGDTNMSLDESEWQNFVQNNVPPVVETKGIIVEEKACIPPELQEEMVQCNVFAACNYEMSACLPDLINLVDHIFQSTDYCTITKGELVHKILVNSFDITERKEVEDQLDLLEKLIPDCICSKLVPSGDILYKMKKMSDIHSVRARLMTV